jgi:hypothetical protein
MVAAIVVGIAAAAVAVRLRSHRARRAARRWARVHPATSPLRSVADMRRAAGQQPGTPPTRSRIYDHEHELLAPPDHPGHAGPTDTMTR